MTKTYIVRCQSEIVYQGQDVAEARQAACLASRPVWPTLESARRGNAKDLITPVVSLDVVCE